ncbi:multicystatin-like isoform X1 [Ananas comosus]|uniref:Cysteine proteinase inhibitor n=1 Tax=Ananas comosus TaxID=4615 RepID=A0A6P5G902_ANACO|nr:multicystatin-like isoform X1 [Ananas comosus]
MGRQISANRGRSLALFLCLALLLLSFCFHHCAAAAAAAREEEEELVKAAAMADEQPKKPVPAAEEAPAAEAEAEEEEGLHLEDDQEPREHPIMGGIYDAPLNNENGFDKEDLARFAVREYNNKNRRAEGGGRAVEMGERLLQPVGDVREVGLGSHNTLAKEDLARFALQHHNNNNNNNNNALLEFVRVVKAKEQVVSGMMHYLTVEVNDAGKKKLYEAKVWEQVWMNFRQLQEFTYLGDA